MALVVALVYSIGRLIQMSQQPVDVKADLTAREVVVSNLTGNSAVISWYSEESVESFINYGSEPGQFTTKVLDYRDDLVPAARNLFYVKVNNLLPERKYYFQITAGTETFNTPESTYSFTTLPALEAISVPDPLLISAPDDFTEGIAYLHASNGDNVSTTGSVYSTNPNISIDKSSLRDRTTGKTFDVGSGNILVSITSSNGKRASGIIKSTDSSLIINSISATNAAYNSNSLVPSATPISNPVSTPTTTPGDTQGNPIILPSCSSSCDVNKYCLCPNNCANPSGV
ncbi:MAG: fibronectin type III domain-containing protein, partial [Candidatus Dojkabacteria bacterium]